MPTNRKLYSLLTVPPVNLVLDNITTAFPEAEPNACLQAVIDETFCIYDHAEFKRCFIQNDPDGVRHFTVTNDTGKPIYLLAVDGCLMTSSEPSRCDCVVFNDKTLCFIEIKTTSFSQRKEQRKKAENQLEASLNYFREKIHFDEKHDIEAYVCLLDSKKFTPCIRSGSVSRVLEFEEMGVSLFYDNKKLFD